VTGIDLLIMIRIKKLSLFSILLGFTFAIAFAGCSGGGGSGDSGGGTSGLTYSGVTTPAKLTNPTQKKLPVRLLQPD
jgi:hypothetical protein